MAGNIRQFDAQGELQPTDRGSTANAIAGGHVASEYGRLGSELGSGVSTLGKAIETHTTQEQTLKALQLSAQAAEHGIADWNQTMAGDAAGENHNPNLATDWRTTKLAPALDDIGKTLTTQAGQQWWAEHRVQIEQHFAETTAADMSTLSGQQAVRDFVATGNSAENLAYMDPSSGNLARGTVDTARALAIQRLGANASPQAIDQINQHFDVLQTATTLAQGRGLIDKAPDPEAAYRQFVAQPEAVTHLNDTQRNSLENYAETTARSNEVKARAAVTAQQKTEDDQADAVQARISAGLLQPDGTMIATPAAISAFHQWSQMPGALRHPEAIRALGNMIESHASNQRKHDADDPTTYSGFVQRALLPEGDPNRLTRDEVFLANANFKISDRTMNQLQEQIKAGPQDPALSHLWKTEGEIVQAAKRAITTSTEFGEADPDGDANFYMFQIDVHKAIVAAQAAGKTPAEIENDLLNPTSTHSLTRNIGFYTGGAQSQAHARALTIYQAGSTGMLNGGTPAVTGAAPAPVRAPVTKPGMTVEQYEASKRAKPSSPRQAAPPPAKPGAPAPPAHENRVL